VDQLSVNEEEKLGSDQTRCFFLENFTRKTWGFFEAFVSPRRSFGLPPDNYQEKSQRADDGPPHIHHNLGLALLGNLFSL